MWPAGHPAGRRRRWRPRSVTVRSGPTRADPFAYRRLSAARGAQTDYGRVSTRGVIPLSWSLDHVGPLARTVLDAAILLQAIAGYDAQEATSVDRPVPRYAAAVKRGAVVAAGRCAAGILLHRAPPGCGNSSRAGARHPVEAHRRRAGGRHTGQSRCECDRDAGGSLCVSCGTSTRSAADISASRVGTSAPGGSHRYARRISSGGGSWTGCVKRRAGLFAHVDLLVTPTVPLLPVLIAEARDDDASVALYARNTRPFNTYGLPAVSVPCGFATNGLADRPADRRSTLGRGVRPPPRSCIRTGVWVAKATSRAVTLD